jgi:hypothetical protein
VDKKNYKSSIAIKLLSYIGFLAIFCLVLFFVLTGIQETRTASDAEGLRLAEESIRRAVISAYASEGQYPANFEHIQRYYGVHIDTRRFFIHYRIFASNIMPNFAVIPL